MSGTSKPQMQQTSYSIFDSTAYVETELVGSLLFDPERIPSVLENVTPGDLSSYPLRLVFETLSEMCREGREISLLSVVKDLERRGNLDAVGGPSAIAETFDSVATPVYAEEAACLVHRAALQRRLSNLHEQAAGDPLDPQIRDEIAKIESDLAESEQHRVNLAEVGFSGDRLRVLRQRPEPTSPLPGILDPEPHLHVLLGKPKSGKTTFALTLARAWAQGIVPW